MNQPQKSFRILLLGDSCYDYYHYGNVERISPEAPIPIFDSEYTEKKHGMTSNVRENFLALGLYVDFQTHFFENKNRYMDLKSKQQLLRVDQKIYEEGMPYVIHQIIDYQKYDAIVISDYDKGFLSYDDLSLICSSFDGPIFIDTKKKHLGNFSAPHIYFKINQKEYDSLESVPPQSHMIVTNGSEHVLLEKPKPDAGMIFYPPKIQSFDVCGAGDTFLASLVFEFLRSERDIEKAIQFAIRASVITIQHIGVYAPTLKEIENEI